MVATDGGPDKVSGAVYRGLGMRMQIKGSPKGRRPPTFAVWHLGTGHRVRNITAVEELASQIATELAELTDWEAFDSLLGWQNTDPDLPNKVRSVDAKYPGKTVGGGGRSNQPVAMQIAMSRGR
jgi:hypothetical protein